MKKILAVCVPGMTMLLFAWSCIKDSAKPSGPVEPPPPGACDTITYTRHIEPIVSAKCISCHNDNLSQGGYAFNTYDRLKVVALNGKLHGVIIEGEPQFMPQGSQLPPEEKELIKCWIANGAKE